MSRYTKEKCFLIIISILLVLVSLLFSNSYAIGEDKQKMVQVPVSLRDRYVPCGKDAFYDKPVTTAFMTGGRGGYVSIQNVETINEEAVDDLIIAFMQIASFIKNGSIWSFKDFNKGITPAFRITDAEATPTRPLPSSELSSSNKCFQFEKVYLVHPIDRENQYILIDEGEDDIQNIDDIVKEGHYKGIKLNSMEDVTHYNRGNEFARKSQYVQAIKDYTKAIIINPEYAEAYAGRGISFAKKGQYDQSIKDITKAIMIDPEYAEAYTNRGISYAKKGQLDQAIKDFSEAIEINNELISAYYNRGHYYAKMDKYEHAIRDFDRVIELNPKKSGAYNKRGWVYLLKLGKKDKGCADWKRACELGMCENYNNAIEKGSCE